MAQQKELSVKKRNSKTSPKVETKNNNLNLKRAAGIIIPKETINKITRDVTAFILEKYSGPLPHPDHFKKYEDVLPGAANRIVKMAEKITQGNIEIDKKILKTGNAISILTSVFAFITAITGFGIAFYAISKGASLEGLGIVIVEIAALVCAFFKGSKETKKEEKV